VKSGGDKGDGEGDEDSKLAKAPVLVWVVPSGA
jgi:hypothetical protein